MLTREEKNTRRIENHRKIAEYLEASSRHFMEAARFHEHEIYDRAEQNEMIAKRYLEHAIALQKEI